MPVIFILMIYGCKTNGYEIKEYFFENQMTAPAEMRFIKKDSIEVYQSENFIKKYGDKSADIFEDFQVLKNKFKIKSPKLTVVLYYEDTVFNRAYDGRYWGDDIKTLLVSNSNTLPDYNIDNLLFHEIIHSFQNVMWDMDTTRETDIWEKNHGSAQWLYEAHALFISYNTKHAGKNIRIDRNHILDYAVKLNKAYANGESYSLKGIKHVYELTELGKYNYGVFLGFGQFIDDKYGIEKFSAYAISLLNDSHENTFKKVEGTWIKGRFSY